MATTETLLPEQAEYLGGFVPREDLDVHFYEHPGMGLLDSPHSVYRTADGERERFDVVVDHPPLDHHQLFTLLVAVAPDRASESPRGVIDDWAILDSPEKRPAGSISELRRHKSLGAPWVEFARSQPAFIETLRDGAMPLFDEETTLSLYLLRHYAQPSLILDNFRRDGASDLSLFVHQLETAGFENVEHSIFGDLAKTDIARVANRKPLSVSPKNIEALCRRFASAPMSQRVGFINRILETKLNDEQRANLLSVLKENYDWAEIDDETWAMPKARLAVGVSLQEEVDNMRTVSYGSWDIQAADVPLSDGSVGRIHMDRSARKVRTSSLMSPHLSWVRHEDGSREFVVERGQNEANGTTTHMDGVLGVLELAYIQPSERAKWRDIGHIGRNHQFMGPAQVPAFAMLQNQAETLLNSAAVSHAEKLM